MCVCNSRVLYGHQPPLVPGGERMPCKMCAAAAAAAMQKTGLSFFLSQGPKRVQVVMKNIRIPALKHMLARWTPLFFSSTSSSSFQRRQDLGIPARHFIFFPTRPEVFLYFTIFIQVRQSKIKKNKIIFKVWKFQENSQ